MSAEVVKKLIWALDPKLRCYKGAISELKTRDNWSMTLTDNGGKEYIYRYDNNYKMLCVRLEGFDEPICPYEECPDFSGNGKICRHLQAELENYRLATGEMGVSELDYDTVISTEEVAQVVDMAANLRGHDRTSIKGHRNLCYSIGKEVFNEYGCDFILTQKQPHSDNLVIARRDLKARGTICCTPNCNMLTPEGNRRAYCVKHIMTVIQQKPTKISVSETVKTMMEQIITDCLQQRIVKSDYEQWKAALRYLYRLGRNGYNYRVEREVDICILPNGQLKYKTFGGKRASTGYLCAYPWCLKPSPLTHEVCRSEAERHHFMCPTHNKESFTLQGFENGLKYGDLERTVIYIDAFIPSAGPDGTPKDDGNLAKDVSTLDNDDDDDDYDDSAN